MLKNYLKIAFRHLRRQKLNTLLNVVGLAVAFTCSLLIFAYIKFELSYDNFHCKSENLYRVVQRQLNNEWRGTDLWAVTTGKLKYELLNNFPEVEKVTRANDYNGRISFNGKQILGNKFLAAEPEFLEMFNFPLKEGNSATALSKPRSLLVTEEMATKLFGNKNPVGEVLVINRIEHTITGILKDIPANSHFKFDFLASFIDLQATDWETHNQGGPCSWQSNNFRTYIQLKEGTSSKKLEAGITQHIKDSRLKNEPTEYKLQNVADIHLKSHANREYKVNGDIQYIVIFTSVAIFLLIIACFNYMNLATVQTFSFSKEISVRKVVGAKAKQISLQYFGESLILTLLAFVISIGLFWLIIPVFLSFIDKPFMFLHINTPVLLGQFLGLVVCTAFLAGSYPAIILSRIKSVNLMKKTISTGKKTIGVRNSFVILQFVISIVLIISTIVLHKQMHYISNQKLGFQSENIVSINIPDYQLRSKYDVFRKELLQYPEVLDVTCSQTSLDFNMWGGGGSWEGQQSDEQILFYSLYVDYNFFQFYNIKFNQGRSFDPKITTDKESACILNTTAINAMGINEPLGKQFQAQRAKGKIVGIVDDFNFQSLHLGIEPLAIAIAKDNSHRGCFSVKISSVDMKESLAFIEKTYKKMSPGYSFNYSFLDDKLNALYQTEQKQGSLFSIFTSIAILVACLGLFGLASFLTKQRIKEIGVRIVNGAKVHEIITMLNLDFIKWVVFAFIVACPIAWLTMNKWLESFSYKTKINLWIYILAGIAAIGIALITVSIQSIRAARSNPVEALRYE